MMHRGRATLAQNNIYTQGVMTCVINTGSVQAASLWTSPGPDAGPEGGRPPAPPPSVHPSCLYDPEGVEETYLKPGGLLPHLPVLNQTQYGSAEARHALQTRGVVRCLASLIICWKLLTCGDSPAAGAVEAAAAQRDSDDTAAEGHEQGVMVFVQLQTENPAVLLTLDITPTHRKQLQNEQQNFSRQQNQNIPLRFSLGWVVDIDVLQQLGSHAVVGMRAGQNLEDPAIFRAQEHHGPVLGQSSGNIDHNLGQFGSVRTKPSVRDEGEVLDNPSHACEQKQVFQWYLLEVLVKQGRSLTEGTASSISGYVLMKVSISSGN